MRHDLLFCLTLLAACQKADDPAADEGTLVSAADGGTVSVDGATLDIPAGALAEDTRITMVWSDDAALTGDPSLTSGVLDLGPDGLTFLTPAELTLDADLPSDLAGQTPAVAWHDGSAWITVPSTVDGAAITGTIEHFTPFAVVLTGDTQTGGQCDPDAIAACGGDLVGTWTYTAGCLTLHEPPPLPCDTATMTLELDITGTLTMNGDGTWAADSTLTTTTTVVIPKSCFPVSDIPCSEIDEAAIDDGDACRIVETSTEDDDEAGAWISAGTTVTFDPDDPETDGPQDYCVDGDTLTLVFRGEDADVVYTATRAP